eukprot:1144261-Pelagomonas_calceolata.AAC.1
MPQALHIGAPVSLSLRHRGVLEVPQLAHTWGGAPAVGKVAQRSERKCVTVHWNAGVGAHLGGCACSGKSSAESADTRGGMHLQWNIREGNAGLNWRFSNLVKRRRGTASHEVLEVLRLAHTLRTTCIATVAQGRERIRILTPRRCFEWYMHQQQEHCVYEEVDAPGFTHQGPHQHMVHEHQQQPGILNNTSLSYQRSLLPYFCPEAHTHIQAQHTHIHTLTRARARMSTCIPSPSRTHLGGWPLHSMSKAYWYQRCACCWAGHYSWCAV